MTPAIVLGPLLVAHTLAATSQVALPQREIHRGAVTVRATARGAKDGGAVGQLEITRGREPTQTIELRPREMSPEMLVGSVQLVDANFDGHLDVVALREFGAKWGASDVYLFDPRTRRFSDASPLARELGRLANATYDAQQRRITTHDIGPSRPSRQVYTVSGDGLRMTESCTFLNDHDERVGTLVRSRLVGGAVRSTFTKLRLGPTDVDPCGF